MTTIQRIDTTPATPVTPDAAASEQKTLLHPASGALILGLDWLLWTGTVATGGLGAAVSGVTGLVAGGAGTAFIQRHFAHDTPRAAFWKGVAAGIIVGAPFPIAGTAIGATVLAVSGLDRLRKRAHPQP